MTSNTASKGLQLVKPSDNTPAPHFRAGEAILQSGMYRVFHAEHRLSHIEHEKTGKPSLRFSV